MFPITHHCILVYKGEITIGLTNTKRGEKNPYLFNYTDFSRHQFFPLDLRYKFRLSIDQSQVMSAYFNYGDNLSRKAGNKLH
jgi:hypothetical protein